MTGISLLVITCYDNSEFSRVVTLKSQNGVFAMQLFPIRKEITVSIYFSHFNLIDDLFVLPCLLHVNRIN